MKWLDKENISALLGEQNSILDYLRWDEHLGEYLNSNNVSMGRGLAGPNRNVWQSRRMSLGMAGKMSTRDGHTGSSTIVGVWDLRQGGAVAGHQNVPPRQGREDRRTDLYTHARP